MYNTTIKMILTVVVAFLLPYSRFVEDLCLYLYIDPNGLLELNDRRDDFNFPIVNFPLLDNNIPASPAYRVYISKLFRYCSACDVYGRFGISARCDLYDPTRMNNVYGRIKLFQRDGSELVQVTGSVYGLKPGLHGMHVLTNGNFGYNCSNGAPHFNPFNKQHGSPVDNNRHVGDLGNILADDWGMANVFIYDHVIQLKAPRWLSILGRSIVVHTDPDDFGRGGSELSLRNGNAGRPLACCQIKQTLN